MNRRSLILGLGSLVLAPSIVRASSLMSIRGEAMDPWVLCGRGGIHAGGMWNFLSGYNNITPLDFMCGGYPAIYVPERERDAAWRSIPLEGKVRHLNQWYPQLVKYRKARVSELGVVA